MACVMSDTDEQGSRIASDYSLNNHCHKHPPHTQVTGYLAAHSVKGIPETILDLRHKSGVTLNPHTATGPIPGFSLRAMYINHFNI